MNHYPTVKSASGNPLYSALSSPIFAKTLIKRFTAESITSRFTSSSIIPKEILEQGTSVTMRRTPEAEVFDYQRNQDLTHSSLNTDTVTLNIDRAKYWSLKLDRIDHKQIPDVAMWIDSFRTSATKKLDLMIGREILSEVVTQVDAYNQGSRAGRISGAYNLGKMGAPVVLTPKNFILKLAELRAVLGEQNVNVNDLVVIVPGAVETLMYHPDCPLGIASMVGDGKSIWLTGKSYKDIAGFEVIFTNELSIRPDKLAQKSCYTIIACTKDAIGAVTQMAYNRVKEPSANFGMLWQGLQLYGFQTVLPEAVAILYATIDGYNRYD